MRKVMGPLVVVVAIVSIYKHATDPTPGAGSRDDDMTFASDRDPVQPVMEVERPDFQCDGRTRCPEMTSCAEATYFLEHCPGMKMDGDGDGIPCEDQWCTYR